MPYTEDKYLGHIPRAFVYIGGKLILCENYSLTINTKGEAGTCNVRIPLENIDSSVFAETSTMGNLYEVQVWSGYIQDGKSEKEQLDDIKQKIGQNKPNNFLTKRFDGYVMQPEWEFGYSRYLNLSCIDWTGLLHEYKFATRVEDGATECRNIISAVQSQIKGITIKLDKNYSGSIKLGTNDNKDNKYVYNATGKSLYDVLTDVAVKLGKIIIADGKNITIASPNSDPNVWKMYYGFAKNQKVGDLPIGQFFESMRIRYGQKGRPGKSNVVVRVIGTNHDKKGEAKKIDVTYPENYESTASTHVEVIRINTSIKEAEAKAIAENKYKLLTKRSITGTVDLPFANNFLMVQDAVEFISDDNGVPDEASSQIGFLKGYWFTVNSISEDYSKSGYTQSIEFEADPDTLNSPAGKRLMTGGN